MIGINASIVGENPTGLGIYSIKLIQELDRLRRDFCVYSSAPEAFPGLRASVLPAPAAGSPGRGAGGHLVRLLWLQSLLRVRARGSRLRLLLNTVPEGILGSSIPQVTVVHDLLPLAFPPEYPRQQYYFRYFVPRILHSSKVVVTDSEYTRRAVIDRYGLPSGQVRVVYPGYNPDVYYQSDGLSSNSRLNKGEEYVLYVGNLLPHKNVLRLLDAVAILRRRRPVRLVIRGEGRPAYARAVRARVETLGLDGAVSIRGYTTERTMRDLYTGAACLVLPSLGEGFGLPVLERSPSGGHGSRSSRGTSWPRPPPGQAFRLGANGRADVPPPRHGTGGQVRWSRGRLVSCPRSLWTKRRAGRGAPPRNTLSRNEQPGTYKEPRE